MQNLSRVSLEYLRTRRGFDSTDNVRTGLVILRNQLSHHISCTKPLYRPEDLGQRPLISTPKEQVTHPLLSHVDTDFDFGQLDDAWSSLWNDDLSNFSLDDASQDTMNSYLLGLP